MDFDRLYDVKGINSESEDNKVLGVLELFDAAKKAKEKDKEVKNFDLYDSYYNLDFMDDEDESLEDWKSKQYVNEAHKEIETLKPFILDNEPRLTTKPLNQKSVEKSTLVNKILEYICNNSDTDYKVVKEMAAQNCYVLGTGIAAVEFCYEKNYTGEILYRVVDPRNFFPDPAAAGISDSRYVIERRFIDVETLIYKYPDKKEKILKMVEGSAETNKDFKSFVHKSASIGPGAVSSDPDKPDSEYRFNDIEVYFCYIRDTTYEKIKEEDGPDGKKYEVRKPKYGKPGRLIVIAQDVFIYDDKNPYPVIPYAKANDFQKAKGNKQSGFWGIGEISLIHTACKEITKCARRSSDLIKQYAYPKMRLDPDCDVNEEDVTNSPEEIIRASQGQFELMSPPGGLTNEHLVWKATLENDCEKHTGQNKAVQGAEPGSAKSGVAIQQLQFMGTKKNKLKAQKFFNFLKELAIITIKIAQKFYPKDRIISIAKRNELDTDVETYEFITLNQTPVNDPGGEIVNNSIRDIEFDLVAQVDEGIFTTRETKKQEALAMHQAGLFTPEAVFYYTDMPEASKMLKSLRQQQQMQAEMAAAGKGEMPNLGGGNFGVTQNGTNLIQQKNNNVSNVAG